MDRIFQVTYRTNEGGICCHTYSARRYPEIFKDDILCIYDKGEDRNLVRMYAPGVWVMLEYAIQTTDSEGIETTQ